MLAQFVCALLLAKGEEPRPWPPLQGIVSMIVGVLVVLLFVAAIVGIRRLLRLE